MTTNPAKNLKGKTEYNDKLPALLTKLMAAGFSDVQVRAEWGISKDTFYRWLRTHEPMKEAHAIGKDMFDSVHEQLGVEGMLKTRDIEYQFWRDLGKFRHGWADKNPQQGNTQINIDNVNILQQQSNEELITFINTNIEALSEFTDIEPRQIIDISEDSSDTTEQEEV